MLTISDEAALIGQTVGRLLSRRDPSAEREQSRADGSGIRTGAWAECVSIGLTGALISSESGGADIGVAGVAAVCEEVGRHNASIPFLSTAVLGGLLLPLVQGSSREATYLSGLLDGRLSFALACGELDSGGTVEGGVELTADGGHWTLNGLAPYVSGGQHADVLGVVARLPEGAPAVVFVDPNHAGVTVTRRWLVDERDGATVAFTDHPVANDHVVAGSPMLERAIDVARLALASEMLGLCDVALSATMAFVTQRVQFDRHIGSFQAVQHRLALLHCEIEMLRSAVRGGVEGADGPDASTCAALAKATASRLGPTVMNECLQLHGGMGMTDGLEIGHLLKRAKVIAMAFGDESHCLELLIADAARHDSGTASSSASDVVTQSGSATSRLNSAPWTSTSKT